MSSRIDERMEDEHYRDEAIKRARDEMRAGVSDARAALRRADKAAQRLGERDLYDVEFSDTNNAETVYVVARNQIDVGLAAIDGLIPREEA